MNRVSVLVGALAVLMLSVAAVTVTSRVTSAGGSNQAATPVDCAANQANDATETPSTAADADQVDQQCGPQDATDGVADGAPDVAGASEPTVAGDTDTVDQQDGPQDGADAPASPATP